MSFYNGYVKTLLVALSVYGQEISAYTESEKEKASFLDNLPENIRESFIGVYNVEQADYAKLMFDLEAVMLKLPYGLVMDIQAFGKKHSSSDFAEIYLNDKEAALALFKRICDNECKEVEKLGIGILKIVTRNTGQLLANATPEISAFLHENPAVEEQARRTLKAIKEDQDAGII